MNMRQNIIAVLLGAGLTVAAASAHAGTIDINLGASSQDFTLYGMGGSPSNSGFGTYTVGQGSSTFDGTTSTFTLSGSITGGSPGFDSGTYAFVTTYLGADTPTAGPNAPFAFANPADPEEFFYDGLAPSTSMVLDLFGTPTGDHVIPLVTAGMFDGPGFSFAFVSPSCSGIAVCDQAGVGLTPGSAIFGAVTIGVSVTTATVPEPSTWAMILLGFAGLGFAGYRRTRVGVSTA
jgi:hypothetical protein